MMNSPIIRYIYALFFSFWIITPLKADRYPDKELFIVIEKELAEHIKADSLEGWKTQLEEEGWITYILVPEKLDSNSPDKFKKFLTTEMAYTERFWSERLVRHIPEWGLDIVEKGVILVGDFPYTASDSLVKRSESLNDIWLMTASNAFKLQSNKFGPSRTVEAKPNFTFSSLDLWVSRIDPKFYGYGIIKPEEAGRLISAYLDNNVDFRKSGRIDPDTVTDNEKPLSNSVSQPRLPIYLSTSVPFFTDNNDTGESNIGNSVSAGKYYINTFLSHQQYRENYKQRFRGDGWENCHSWGYELWKEFNTQHGGNTNPIAVSVAIVSGYLKVGITVAAGLASGVTACTAYCFPSTRQVIAVSAAFLAAGLAYPFSVCPAEYKYHLPERHNAPVLFGDGSLSWRLIDQKSMKAE